MISRPVGVWLLAGVTAAVILAALLAPRTPQPEAYHHFADQRQWAGVQHFGDVASNTPFALIGVWGLIFHARKSAHTRFLDRRERYPYTLVFVGLLLTACGSAYYHLAPDNTRLVWDRLPMTLVFMSLVAAMIAERISVQTGLGAWPLLILAGAGSVLQWYWSEVRKRGRPAVLCGGAGLRNRCPTGGFAFAGQVHANFRFGRDRGVLCARQDPRVQRRCHLFCRTYRQRAHPQAPGSRGRRILDFAHASKTPPDFPPSRECRPTTFSSALVTFPNSGLPVRHPTRTSRRSLRASVSCGTFEVWSSPSFSFWELSLAAF